MGLNCAIGGVLLTLHCIGSALSDDIDRSLGGVYIHLVFYELLPIIAYNYGMKSCFVSKQFVIVLSVPDNKLRNPPHGSRGYALKGRWVRSGLVHGGPCGPARIQLETLPEEGGAERGRRQCSGRQGKDRGERETCASAFKSNSYVWNGFGISMLDIRTGNLPL